MGDLVRRVKSGQVRYYVRYVDVDGHRRMRASKQPSAAEARRMLIEIEARVARGLAGVPEPVAPAPTVAQMVERFLAEYDRPRLKNPARYFSLARSRLSSLCALVGKLRADEITAGHMAKLRNVLMQNHTSNTVRTTMAQVATTFNWALKAGLCSTNPVKGLEMPTREDAVDFLSSDEVKALLALSAERAATGGVADKLAHVRITFALHTGLRKGELCGLRWRDLDIKSRRLTIAKSYRTTPKSGKPRHLRLPDEVVSLLLEWQPLCPQTPDGLVFPTPLQYGRGWGMPTDTSATMGLPKLLVEAGCRPNHRPWHLLRHTFASHFMMAGGSLLTLSKILGHAEIKITMIYAHLAPDFIGQEMNRLKY